MSGVESNALLPEDELQAALAEIEQMTGDDAAVIPDLDDGRGDMVEEAAPAVKETEVEADEPAAADRAGPLSIESIAEEVAALEAQVERGAVEEAAAAEGRAGAAGGTAGAAETGASRKKIRLVAGKQAEERDVADYEPPADLASATGGPLPAHPRAPLGIRIFRVVDNALLSINRPFEWIGADARRVLGYAGLVTLLVALLAMAVMPVIMPHRDAVVFVQERVAELGAASPAGK